MATVLFPSILSASEVVAPLESNPKARGLWKHEIGRCADFAANLALPGPRSITLCPSGARDPRAMPIRNAHGPRFHAKRTPTGLTPSSR